MGAGVSEDFSDIDGYWTVAKQAEYFVAAALHGHEKWGRYDGETIYGQVAGFVYFVAIGEPYITHVKIGFTAKDPHARMKGLQTGCPFKMRMLGFIVGNIVHEQELHDVLRDYRLEGEWFEYSDYVARIIRSQMETEYP